MAVTKTALFVCALDAFQQLSTQWIHTIYNFILRVILCEMSWNNWFQNKLQKWIRRNCGYNGRCYRPYIRRLQLWKNLKRGKQRLQSILVHWNYQWACSLEIIYRTASIYSPITYWPNQNAPKELFWILWWHECWYRCGPWGVTNAMHTAFRIEFAACLGATGMSFLLRKMWISFVVNVVAVDTTILFLSDNMDIYETKLNS